MKRDRRLEASCSSFRVPMRLYAKLTCAEMREILAPFWLLVDFDRQIT